MKLLHVINNLGSGGAEKLLVDLLESPDFGNTDLLLLSKSNTDTLLNKIEKNAHITSKSTHRDFNLTLKLSEPFFFACQLKIAEHF